MWLRVVMPVPDHRVAAASRATDALWPAVLAHQGEALRVVEQGCEVDRVHCGHDDRTPCLPATADRLKPSSYLNAPPQASITPEADKSHDFNQVTSGAPKNVQIAGVRVAAECLLHLQRQPVHTFAHVGSADRQPHPNPRGNRDHRRSRTSSTSRSVVAWTPAPIRTR